MSEKVTISRVHNLDWALLRFYERILNINSVRDGFTGTRLSCQTIKGQTLSKFEVGGFEQSPT